MKINHNIGNTWQQQQQPATTSTTIPMPQPQTFSQVLWKIKRFPLYPRQTRTRRHSHTCIHIHTYVCMLLSRHMQHQRHCSQQQTGNGSKCKHTTENCISGTLCGVAYRMYLLFHCGGGNQLKTLSTKRISQWFKE